MNEGNIQFAIHNYRQWISSSPLMVPNIFLWNWESDLLYLTNCNYAVEWEIKLSRSDFRADFQKQYKHNVLAGKYHPVGPSEFYFACPQGLIDKNEVPEYAGLVWVNPDKCHVYNDFAYDISVVKKAPRRKTVKLTDKQVLTVLRKGTYRYWSLKERTQEELF